MKRNRPTPKEKKTMKRTLGIAAAAAAIASMSLAASASAAVVTVSSENVEFGSQAVGTTSSTQTVTLGVPCLYVLDLGPYAGGKRCSAPGRVDSIAVTGDFSQINNCPLPINNNAIDGSVISCTITVSFSPTTNGARTGNVNLGSYGNDAAYSFALNGTGTTPPPVDTGGNGGNGGTGGNGDDGKSGTKGQAGESTGGAVTGAAAKCKKGKKKAAKKCKKRKARR